MPAETVAATQVSKEVHSWEAGGATSPEALTAWVGARLAGHEAALAALLEGRPGLGMSQLSQVRAHMWSMVRFGAVQVQRLTGTRS